MTSFSWGDIPIPPDPGFGEWTKLPSAVFPSAPGWYLARSLAVAGRWNIDQEGEEPLPWRTSGVIYIGTSWRLSDRLEQLRRTALGTAWSHPCSARYRDITRPYLAEDGLIDSSLDMEVCWALAGTDPPAGRDDASKRCRAAERAFRESIEAAIVADTIAHRLVTGCQWRLLNYIDRNTLT